MAVPSPSATSAPVAALAPGFAPGAPRFGLLVAMFLVSGATSLVYQTVWARQLHLVFGTSQLAVATLLAAFLGGLALGALAAGRWARRVRRPLVAYAVLEGVIGLYALAFPALLAIVDPLAIGFWRAFAPSPLVFGLFQFVLASALLLPPTFCMGATLPLLARYIDPARDDAGRLIGRLYGANTIGAVAGTAVAGFALLPQLGLARTTLIAAVGNGVLALAALAIARRVAAPVPHAAAAEAPTTAATRRTPARKPSVSAGVLLVAAIAGFCGLLYEVAWFRLMVLMLGGSAYAFSTMLLAFLAGIGLGGSAGGAYADRAHRRGTAGVLIGLAVIQTGVAGLAYAALCAYGELPVAFVWLHALGERAPWLMWPGRLALAFALMFPPALLMGAAFPFLVRAAAAGDDTARDLAGPVGRVYGVNTIGAVVGAVAGGFLVLPALHVYGAVLAAAALNLVAALVALAEAAPTISRPRRRRLAWAFIAAPVIAGAAFLIAPAWNPMLMTAGFYQYADYVSDRSRAGIRGYAVERSELLFYDEGLSSVVTVGRNDDGNIWLANNGKIDASSQGDLETQTLLTAIPFALRPRPDHVLIVGLASGISAGIATLHPEPSRIDVAEIEPVVVTASHAFDVCNHRPLDDPRTRLVLDDARHHLRRSADGTYDLVMSEPSNPWISGVANLFTRECFELGRRKLSERGVWGQWVHTYDMRPDDLRSLLGTFADVFEHVRLFCIDDADLLLVGSRAPLPIDTATLDRAMHVNPAVNAAYRAVGLRHAEQVLALYLMGHGRIGELAAGVERNTDDNMRVEYGAATALNRGTIDANLALLRRFAVVPIDMVDDAAGLTRLAAAYLREGDRTRATVALDAAEERNPLDTEIAALRDELSRD